MSRTENRTGRLDNQSDPVVFGDQMIQDFLDEWHDELQWLEGADCRRVANTLSENLERRSR